MVRSCGIHIDRDYVRVVSLDGGAKKHKLAIQDEEPINGSIAQALKAISKRNKLKAEDIGLAVESSNASFRRMTLPFDDREKIEEVIKFEVEADLPQWDIDDIIVDFLVTDSLPGVSSDVVVCAVPKDGLEASIEQLSKAGLEPAEAELDASAAFDAVLTAGELDAEAGAILLHIGDGSTIVSVADGERLVSMRALRMGAKAARVVVAEQAGEPADDADGDSDSDASAEVDEALAAPLVLTESEQRRHDEKVVTRLRRELMRTMTGARTENEISVVLLTGSHIEGLDRLDLDGVEVRWVGALEGEIQPVSMVAYGAALHQLGAGVFKPSMRREELRYTGTLERLELPLAVFSMLLFAFLVTRFMIVRTHLGWRDEGSVEEPGDMQIWLNATLSYLLPIEGQWPGRVEKPSEALLDYAKLAKSGGDENRTKFQELKNVKSILQHEILEIQKSLGQVSEITLPLSAFKGGVLVMDVMDAMQSSKTVPRFGCRGFQATYVQRKASAGGDVVEVKLDLDFWGDDALAATKHFNDFKTEMERQPWCEAVEAKQVKSLDGQPVTYVEGMRITVDPKKVEVKGGAR